MAEVKLLSYLTMKSLRYYSVSTRRLGSSLGLNQPRVADHFMWESKTRKGNNILHPFHVHNCQNRLETSRTNQDSSDGDTLIITGEIARTGFRTSSNFCGYITASSKTCITNFREFTVSSSLSDAASSISFLVPEKIFSPTLYYARSLRVGVESDQHLFLECDHTAQLWRELIPSWDQFFSSRPRWTHIACGIVPTVRSDWKEYLEIILELWLAFQAVTLHFVWTDRNHRLFDKLSATPIVPGLPVIYTTFSVHVRYHRTQCYEQEDRNGLAKFLEQLQTHGSFRGFF